MKTLLDNEFSSNDRAYPFANGELQTGIIVSSNSVTFTGQRGAVKEVGVNGCQIDDMVVFARLTIEAFNKKFPCRENSIVITKLEEAEMWLGRRKQNREILGIEGFNK